MPKIIDYPRASVKRAVGLAEVVDRLGGECTAQSAAEAMGNKVGGSFNALIGASVKYGFISSKGGKLKIEPLFTDYKLAYTESEKQEHLKKAFLSAPLFAAIAKRFEHMLLPPHFENLLIREHDVPEDLASRMVNYFTEGAKESGILQADGTVNAWPKNVTVVPGTANLQANASSTSTLAAALSESSTAFVPGYIVRITGPGIDSTIAIKDEDDVGIVEIMLKKVRKLLASQDPLLS